MAVQWGKAQVRDFNVKRLIVLICILASTFPILAQAEKAVIPAPVEVARLGRGTAATIDWHPDGEILAVGGSLGLWLYDETLSDIASFPDAGDILALAWSPYGDQIAVVGRDQTLRIWEVSLDPFSMTFVNDYSLLDDSTYFYAYLAWSPIGDRLAVLTSNGAQVIDLQSTEILITIPDMESGLAWHPDGTQLAGAVDLGDKVGKQVRTWDAFTGEVVKTYFGMDSYLFWSDLSWSPNGSEMIGVTSVPAIIHVWDVATGELMNDVDRLRDELGAYIDMWWNEDGQQLITASRSVTPPGRSSVNIWNTASWTIEDQKVYYGPVQSISKHPDSELWALVTGDGQLVIWSLEEEGPIQVQSKHGQPPNILEWSPDNRYLVTARRTGEVFSIWDISTLDRPQSQVITVPIRGWDVDEFRWSTDSESLLGFVSIPMITAPGTYSTAFVFKWDTKTGESLGMIHETPGYVAHDGSGDYLPRYIWSDDFSRVVTQMGDEPLTISTVGDGYSDLSPNEEVARIEVESYPTQLTWSPDNTMVAVITRDPQNETKVWVYDAETGESINQLRTSFSSDIYSLSWSADSSLVALSSSHLIAGSGATEYRLDVLQIDLSSNEAAHITTILDTDTRFYSDWHPEQPLLAVTTSDGVGVYSVDPASDITVGLQAEPNFLITAGHVYALSWSHDGTRLAGSHEDGTIRIWDVSMFSQ
ncbi:MAG: WD40 repeat domain-containing protein [Anaerolineaceae bacterium]|nr:WD40 repeat domain-containing protein [Anaerolineaceae bacterium]